MSPVRGTLAKWSGIRWCPSLQVADLGSSLRCYVDIFGFQVAFRREQPPFAYLTLGFAQLMLEQDHPAGWRTGEVQSPRGRGINLQIEVTDVTALRQQITDAGWPLFRDLTEVSYAVGHRTEAHRELLVQDRDGYLLRFVDSGEPAKGAE